jgi:hypothetical protein
MSAWTFSSACASRSALSEVAQPFLLFSIQYSGDTCTHRIELCFHRHAGTIDDLPISLVGRFEKRPKLRGLRRITRLDDALHLLYKTARPPHLFDFVRTSASESAVEQQADHDTKNECADNRHPRLQVDSHLVPLMAWAGGRKIICGIGCHGGQSKQAINRWRVGCCTGIVKSEKHCCSDRNWCQALEVARDNVPKGS